MTVVPVSTGRVGFVLTFFHSEFIVEHSVAAAEKDYTFYCFDIYHMTEIIDWCYL